MKSSRGRGQPVRRSVRHGGHASSQAYDVRIITFNYFSSKFSAGLKIHKTIHLQATDTASNPPNVLPEGLQDVDQEVAFLLVNEIMSNCCNTTVVALDGSPRANRPFRRVITLKKKNRKNTENQEKYSGKFGNIQEKPFFSFFCQICVQPRPDPRGSLSGPGTLGFHTQVEIALDHYHYYH